MASYAAGGRARTVDRSSRLRADRRDRRSGPLRATGQRTRSTLGGRLGASRLEPRDARLAFRPVKRPMLQRRFRGGVAGAVATVVMTLEQPLDKRLFDSRYDDVEILGKLVTRGDYWQPIGFALHVQNGAIFGVAYTRLKPGLPGPPVLRGLLVGLIGQVAAWGGPATCLSPISRRAASSALR